MQGTISGEDTNTTANDLDIIKNGQIIANQRDKVEEPSLKLENDTKNEQECFYNEFVCYRLGPVFKTNGLWWG